MLLSNLLQTSPSAEADTTAFAPATYWLLLSALRGASQKVTARNVVIVRLNHQAGLPGLPGLPGDILVLLQSYTSKDFFIADSHGSHLVLIYLH